MQREEVGERMKKKVRGGGEAKLLSKKVFFRYQCGPLLAA
jgi:hypothetical protein